MSTLNDDLVAVIAYLPRVAGALLVLLVGYIVARIVGRVVAAVLHGVGADRVTEHTRLADDLAAVGLPPRPSRLLGRGAFALVLVATLVQAVDALGLAPLSQSLRQLLEFTPHVVLAVLVLLAGAVGGDVVGRAAAAALSGAGVVYHGMVGALVRVLILLLALLLAMQQLTIDATFLLAVLLVALGGIALAGAIALGWGARTMADNLASARYVEQNFAVGDRVAVDGVCGVVEAITATSIALRTADGGKAVVPNSVVARTTVAPAPSESQEA